MTQPIQEPSTDRALQGFAYARDQIFRRPAPVSGDTGVCANAYMFYDDFGTIPDENTVNITGYSDADASGVEIDPNPATGQFEITETGIYLVQLVILFDDTFAGDKMASINTTGGNILQDTNAWENWSSAQNLGTNIDSVTAEALLFVTSVSTDVLVGGKVRQTSGVNQTLASADFSIVRMCPYSSGFS